MIGDILYLETADGEKLYSPDTDVRFLAYGNFGAPPVNWITRSGYKLHGVLEVDYLLQPRTITITLWHSPACTRQQYWDNRAALHSVLRHNRGGPMKLVLIQPNNSLRAITVRANPGLVLPPPDNNNWDINESLDLIAHDPVWYDPTATTTTFTSVVDDQLVFPVTFPIRFGTTGQLFANSVTYAGDWPAYPTITLTGPYSAVRVTNVTMNISLWLNVPVAAGDTRVITLAPGNQRIVDTLGNSKFGELSPNSNLVDWALQPDPIVPGGVQRIEVAMDGGAVGMSAFSLTYYARYFAL